MANENRVTVIGRLITGADKLYKPDENNNNKHRALVVLEDGQEAKIKAATTHVIQAKWGDKVPAKLDDYTVQFGDDPEFDSTFERHFIHPKNHKVPQILKRDQNGLYVAVPQEEGLFYSGCYVAVNVDVYAYAANKEKNIKKAGVSMGLNAVMFYKDGPRLDNAVNAEDAFGDLPELDENDDMFA